MIRVLLLAAGSLLLALSAAGAQPPAIQNGSSVSLEYTLRDDTGEVLDTNKGRGPLTYTQGQQQIIPGLERELMGMKLGEEKKVMVKPEDAYGPVVPSAQTEVPKNVLPDGALKVGTRLMARSTSGESRPVMVKQIKDSTVVLDLNHPLAGKTLFFDVKVLGVEPPKSATPKPSQ